MPYELIESDGKWCVAKKGSTKPIKGSCFLKKGDAVDFMDELEAEDGKVGSMPSERKSFPIDVAELRRRKAEDQDFDPRVVPAYYAVMGLKDTYNDVIFNGAFKKTIKERPDRIKVLWQHDGMSPPVGVPLSLKEVDFGDFPDELKKKYPKATGALRGEVKFLNTPRGDEVLEGIYEGAVTENSIGFDAVKFDFEEDKDAAEDYGWKPMKRNLRELRLWDISPVNWGANEASRVLMGLKMDLSHIDLRSLLFAAQVHIQSQVKAGRVLSASNLSKLKNALDVLSEILLAAEPSDDESAKTLQRKASLVMQRLRIAEREMTQGV